MGQGVDITLDIIPAFQPVAHGLDRFGQRPQLRAAIAGNCPSLTFSRCTGVGG